MSINIVARKYMLNKLVSQADSSQDIKKNLLNVYSLYVNPSTAKEPVLQMVADAGEPTCQLLLEKFKWLIQNINSFNSETLFEEITKIKDIISFLKNDPDKKIRNFIHDSIRATKESERNYREHVKSKFEMVLGRIASLLGVKSEDPKRKELSKDKLLMFKHSPEAQLYGLDNIEILTKILSYPDLKAKLTTLINAIDRKKTPKDADEINKETAELSKWFKLKQTNEGILESGEDTWQQSKVPELDIKQKAPKNDTVQPVNITDALQQQQKAKEDQIEKDRERLLSNVSSYSLLDKLLKGTL